MVGEVEDCGENLWVVVVVGVIASKNGLWVARTGESGGERENTTPTLTWGASTRS